MRTSRDNVIQLRLDDLSYYLVCQAAPYWSLIAEGGTSDKSMQGMVRKAAVNIAKQLLQSQGVLDKVLESYSVSALGKKVINKEEAGITTPDGELP